MENMDKKWYLVQVVSNYEYKVKEQLDNRIFGEGEADEIEEIFLPTTTIVNKSGSTREKPLFPGYIFVKVDMTDESWYIIRNTQYVTGIVGSSGQRTKPTPIPQSQIDQMVENKRKESEKNNSEEVVLTSANELNFKVGEIVDILAGSFQGNFGKVTDINVDKGTVSVETEFFGRKTEVPVPFNEVKKK